MTQIAIPVEVSPDEVVRKRDFGASIDLCLEIGGRTPKEVQADLSLDKAQFSRWHSGQEGVTVPKLFSLMDYCGNDAPLMWLNHARNWDLHSMRRVETETERLNRMLREENAALKRILLGSH
jgi:plasmid maintenance system antidote protein VapI